MAKTSRANNSNKDIIKFRDELRSLNKRLSELISDTKNYGREIQRQWPDPVGQKYMDEFENYFPDMERLSEKIKDYSENVLTDQIIPKVDRFVNLGKSVSSELKDSRFD